MPRIESKAKIGSDEFEKNAKANRKLAEELAALQAEVAKGGSERARKKHLSRDKLLPRDRIRKVVDRGAPFLEIGRMLSSYSTTKRVSARTSPPSLTSATLHSPGQSSVLLQVRQRPEVPTFVR